jgi:DNA-binding transcriptional MerR regulator
MARTSDTAKEIQKLAREMEKTRDEIIRASSSFANRIGGQTGQAITSFANASTQEKILQLVETGLRVFAPQILSKLDVISSARAAANQVGNIAEQARLLGRPLSDAQLDSLTRAAQHRQKLINEERGRVAARFPDMVANATDEATGGIQPDAYIWLKEKLGIRSWSKDAEQYYGGRGAR